MKLEELMQLDIAARAAIRDARMSGSDRPQLQYWSSRGRFEDYQVDPTDGRLDNDVFYRIKPKPRTVEVEGYFWETEDRKIFNTHDNCKNILRAVKARAVITIEDGEWKRCTNLGKTVFAHSHIPVQPQDSKAESKTVRFWTKQGYEAQFHRWDTDSNAMTRDGWELNVARIVEGGGVG